MSERPEWLQQKSTWVRTKNDDILCPFCDVRCCTLTEMDTLMCRNPKCGRHVNLQLAIKSCEVDFAHIDFLKDLSLHERSDLVIALKESYNLARVKDKEIANADYRKIGDKWVRK